MRIHSLTIDNVRAIEHLEISGLPETGVVVVHGDNEQGKSTIMDALDAVLHVKHSSSSREIKQLAPVHRDEAPEVSVRLTVGPVELSIRKRWLKRKSSELTVHAPKRANYTGAEADLKLEEILDEHLDRSLLEALFLRQGQFDEGIKTAGIPSLQRALGGEQDGETTDAGEDDTLMAAVEREYLRYYTATGKENKALSNTRRDREKAAEELDDAAQKLRALQSYVDQVDRHEQARDADRANLPEARSQLAEAEEALASARQAQSTAVTVQAEVERARQDVSTAERIAAERAELRGESAELQTTLRELEEQLTVATAKAQQQKTQVAELTEKLEQAKRRRGAAIEDVKKARRTVQLLENVAARDELAKLVDRLDMIDTNISALRAQAAGIGVTDKDVRAVERAAQDVAVAQRIRDMSLPRLELSAPSATTLKVDGESLSVGEPPVRVNLREGTELSIGQVTAVYRAGDSADVSAEDTARRAEAELADLLGNLGCADVGELRRIREESRSTADALARLEQQRVDLLGGRSADDVRARAAHLEDQLSDTEIPEIELEVARAGVSEAELERDEADQAADKAEGSLSSWRDSESGRELVRVQANYENTAQREAAVSAKLAALEQERPTQTLELEVDAARERLNAAEQKLRQAETLVAEADPEGKNAAVDASRARVESLTGRIKHAEVELARLDGYITQAAGAAERLEKAQSADQALAHQLGSLERRASAAERLREILRRHREEARARYSQPFVDELSRLARTVFGPDVAFGLTENLAVRDRTLGGATVPLASLSGGAREQLAILTRFAVASLVSGEGQMGVPVIIDDALGSTDPGRLQRMGQLFTQMGKETQVIVLTCFPQRYDWVHPKTEFAIGQLKSGG